MRRGRNKFRAQTTIVDDIKFPSKAEALCYLGLKDKQTAGRISALERQVWFELKVNGHLICRIRPDFKYYDNETQGWVVHESKGFPTAEWKLKAKLFQALYPEFEYRVTK